MPVIVGIQTAIKIAKIVYKVSKVGYKVGSKTRRGAAWLKSHPKIARYGTIAASSAPLIYDLLNIDYSGIFQAFPKYGKGRQTRNNMEFPRVRQRFNKDCYPRTRRTGRRKEYFY